MARVTENWFYENKDIHHSELANFLDDVIIAEFNCDVQVIIPFPVSIILYPAPTVTFRTAGGIEMRDEIGIPCKTFMMENITFKSFLSFQKILLKYRV